MMGIGRYITLKAQVRPNTAVGWLAKGKACYASASDAANAPLFTSIASQLNQLNTANGALDGEQAKVGNKGRTDYSNRNVAWGTQKKAVRAFVGSVQGLCDAAPDLEHALQIAAAAGLAARNQSRTPKAELSAKALGNAAVHLYAKLPAKSTGRIFHEWQMSKDGGANWSALPTTNDANLLVPNLPVGATIWFRHRVTVKNTPSDWATHIEIPVR